MTFIARTLLEKQTLTRFSQRDKMRTNVTDKEFYSTGKQSVKVTVFIGIINATLMICLTRVQEKISTEKLLRGLGNSTKSGITNLTSTVILSG